MILIEDLSYAYPAVTPDETTPWILQHINLTIEAGEFVAVMGPTGVGKTTLCLALNGLVPQSTGGRIKGNVFIDGLNTKREPVAALAQRVGLVFQDPETQLFNMSVEAEVAFGLESLGIDRQTMHERIEWSLALVGMQDFQKQAPFHLSGGQKQRVAIAAVLAMMPNVLVLDEPTANLDPLGKREVFSVIRTLREQQGMTVIMVEHESEWIAEFADRVIVLTDDGVALDGSPTDVFSQVDKMAEIGVSIPQVSAVAHSLNQRLGKQYTFTRLEEAYQALHPDWTMTHGSPKAPSA